jgi:two-component system OmpR family sensor kinase
MRGPRPFIRLTLGVKLALVLFGVVLGALGIVYLMVVPRLENRLVDAKIRDLERAAPAVQREIAATLPTGGLELTDAVDAAATNLNARVVVLQAPNLLVYRDSRAVGGTELRDDPVLAQALETGAAASGRARHDGRAFAEVAAPLGGGWIILLSAPLDDALASVRLIRGSLLVAALVALVASAVAAYTAAFGLTRRLRRLETAARRIAAGDFSVPIPAEGNDEIAELAREFDAMRVRLADLDRVRREFIANASHELRTPLFSLGGFLELLADEDLDEETRREFIEETRRQVFRLTRLATDLLDLSRLDAGQLEVEEGTADLANVARLLADEFRVIAETERHPLTVAAPSAVPALGDHDRIVQIGRALVENALRHTPPGTAVEISAEQTDAAATLAVRDAGPGVAEEDRERIFQRFYRASGGMASGSGLGLAIAAELAERMDGRLELESEPGSTRFRLHLRAPEAISRENGASAEPAAEREPATTL